MPFLVQESTVISLFSESRAGPPTGKWLQIFGTISRRDKGQKQTKPWCQRPLAHPQTSLGHLRVLVQGK